ncbi:transposase [Streptomyces sp. NPDC056488]|uniref:transposase n=1 Tax=unclassified Streptomyces TaxID=2593676 RepID=UPI0036C57F8E
MARRHELTDAEWEVLSGLLPRASSGRPRLDDRWVLNGIVWKLRTGSAWRDVPERYGSWRTLYTRFRRWARRPSSPCPAPRSGIPRRPWPRNGRTGLCRG